VGYRNFCQFRTECAAKWYGGGGVPDLLVAIGGSIFLILEKDRPLDGVMRISSWPVDNVLAHMNW
jgi:hypothetical protein